ncbi:NagD protein [Halanaerobium saccharolyticum]|uniref:Acid sugar phosphatase n=1 Tax=Halanaerobium saccharolyticum TaxID=43595 RepID=A0A4R7Z763_9FIRM|nr:HAD-IIA family hydrolase [Halanaerobium saccharolyticum]RAK09757.1 NagD protein [Halanaerobium saccharolyticum]TDW07319.1 NagD protein [Halanaerobium saccharolyticum]TDX61198.1 NagD protein [Halanaerobium saccharolyticum]
MSDLNDLKEIKFFMLDMDGTIYLENDILKGSLDFLEKLEKTDRDYIFLTNNSSKNRADYQQKLAQMQIEVTAEKIINSGEITASYLAEEGNKKGKRIYLLGTESLKKEMERFGHQIVNGEENIKEKAESVDYVVLGFDKSLTYQKLWDAHELILSGVNYVATHPDLVCPLSGGKTQPDTGAMIELLAATTGKRPLIVGKPSNLTVEYILKRFNLKKSELAMVGDRLYTDMRMAHDAGITGILVLSGESKRDDLKELSADQKYYDYVFESVAELKKEL